VRFAIARRAIASYSEPGDLVVDPLCTDPKLPVVLEALRQRRHGAAVIGHDVGELTELEKRVSAARARGAGGEAVLLRGDPPELPRLLAAQADNLLRHQRQLPPNVGVHPGGSADLILTFLPADAADLLSAAAVVLRPGGYFVAVTGDELDSAARDTASETVSHCEELGLHYWQHIVALLVPIEGGELKAPRTRQHANDATPRIVHQNVHVFRKPTTADACANSQSIETRSAA
jgi:modification methylase